MSFDRLAFVAKQFKNYLKDNLAYIFVADLLGSQYLLEILQTSLTVKDSGNVVKRRYFEKRLQ